MMSEPEEPPSAKAALATKTIEVRWRGFERSQDYLLAMLQEDYERTPQNKSFDKNKARKDLRFVAGFSIRADKENRRENLSAAVRAARLHKLGETLSKTHSMVKEAKESVLGHLFVQWCISITPDLDFTHPIIEKYEQAFEEKVLGILEGLETLARTAHDAAQTVRQKTPSPGRPPGTSFPGHDVILGLERVYRENTGKQAGAGDGPFARFVSKFLEAVGRKYTMQRIIEAIKAAKKREEKNPATSRWGRSQEFSLKSLSDAQQRTNEIPSL
jgi:hypothetical protein